MAILVYAEHDNKELKKATLNTVTAASKIGGDIVVLVAGLGCEAVAEQAAKVAGVSKVLCASNAAFEHQLAENVAKLVVSLAGDYSHIVAPATTTGKNFLPRVAALLDVNMLTDVTAVIDAETFERPIYAGNAIATVKDTESKKVITVRTTAFDAAATEGGAASIEPAHLSVVEHLINRVDDAVGDARAVEQLAQFGEIVFCEQLVENPQQRRPVGAAAERVDKARIGC